MTRQELDKMIADLKEVRNFLKKLRDNLPQETGRREGSYEDYYGTQPVDDRKYGTRQEEIMGEMLEKLLKKKFGGNF